MSAARQFFARTPRYLLSESDERVLRFAEMKTRGVTHEAVVRDVSATGLCFAIRSHDENDAPVLPEEGDMLKIEFTIPGDQQIACFGTVVRLDAHKAWHPELGESLQSLVGVQFRHLPNAHARVLHASLQPRTSGDADFDWSKTHAKHKLTLTVLTIAMALLLWTLASPPELWLRAFTAL